MNQRVFHFVFPLILLLAFVSSSCKKNTVPRSTPFAKASTEQADSVSFIVIGDWGKEGTEFQKVVANQMDIQSRKFNAQFIITTGDNFYPVGVKDVDDPHWQKSFNNIYNKKGHQIPWYPVLGNHDYATNPQAQIDFSKHDKRWSMPARYYHFNKEVGDSLTALFLFTDTSPFLRGYHRRERGDIRSQDTASQLKWMKNILQTSNDKWKIVIGHHPIYSAGSHGRTITLQNLFKPAFLKNKVDFFISGHDHSLQYLKIKNQSLRYLISGGGSSNTSVYKRSFNVFAKSTTGFMVMTLYPSKANFYFIDQHGNTVYSHQVIKTS
jgi:tartrate-resistant acid phosphatase type 5